MEKTEVSDPDKELPFDMDKELPFDMQQIKTGGSADEPDRERFNYVRARFKLELETKMTKLSPTKSEPIKSEIVTNHIATAPNAKEVATEKKAKLVKRALPIVEAGDYRVAKFGRLPANSARILWRADGSMITPKGISMSQRRMSSTFLSTCQSLYLTISVSFHTIGTQYNVDIALKQYIPIPR